MHMTASSLASRSCLQTLLFMANANSDHVLELGSAREVSCGRTVTHIDSWDLPYTAEVVLKRET